MCYNVSKYITKYNSGTTNSRKKEKLYIKKYNYFKLGYKCDSKGNLKYIIYAIPGKKDKDEQPYDGRTGFVTWVAKDSDTDIGCWLMFYDFKNSTVVVPMQ